MVETKADQPPAELLIAPAQLDTYEGKLKRIVVQFCACGTPWAYQGDSSLEGWNICKSCGIDQRKLPLQYQPAIQTLWNDRGVTEDGRVFISKQGQIVAPATMTPDELKSKMEQDQEINDAERKKKSKRNKPSASVPDLEIIYVKSDALLEMIKTLVECDVFTDSETWERDTDKDEIRHKVGRKVFVSKIQHVDPSFVSYLRTVLKDYRTYFSYPLHKLDAMKSLFRVFGEDVFIAPLAEPGPDTKTARGECARRGGCGGTIGFPRPANIEILKKYPAAYQQACDPDCNWIEFSDYKLALQLHFYYGFPLKGNRFKEDVKAVL
jgi:hypothetical protein